MARKEKKYHFIYKTTCLVTGRYYIGMHSTSNLDDGYMGSGKRIRRSLNKYGEENHQKEILEFCNSRKELKSREEEIVNLNEIAKKDCMNLIVGGEGGFSSEQQKLNAEKSNAKQKILREDPEWVKNKSNKLSKSLKKVYDEGRRERKEFYNWSGLTHSAESKKIMSESSKGKGIGSENSQYGTCWITKDGINKKIKKEELEIFVSQGWKKGRKLK